MNLTMQTVLRAYLDFAKDDGDELPYQRVMRQTRAHKADVLKMCKTAFDNGYLESLFGGDYLTCQAQITDKGRLVLANFWNYNKGLCHRNVLM